jgi:hypothetical protein
MGEPDKLDEGDRRLVTALLELSSPIRLQRWNVTSIATACTGGAGGIGR